MDKSSVNIFTIVDIILKFINISHKQLQLKQKVQINNPLKYIPEVFVCICIISMNEQTSLKFLSLNIFFTNLQLIS